MQGFNMGRYYPPSTSTSDPPTFNKTHPLGARARKLRSEGILTVRFEMPFAIWCSHCPKPTIIGQGVRFNAEKKKVGNYYSTPLWSFRMKHVVCGGVIEIRTDPKAGEYIVTEGAKRRDYGDERVEEGVVDEEERMRRREDAMAGLEGRKGEEMEKKEAGKRIDELRVEKERFWADPGEANRLARRGFRKERRERNSEREKAARIQERLGIGVDLLPENDEDRARAGMIDFGTMGGDGSIRAVNKPLFDIHPPKIAEGHPHATQMTKSASTQRHKKRRLEEALRSNTRAALDPWGPSRTGGFDNDSTTPATISKLRRRPDQPSDDARSDLATTAPIKSAKLALVAYDSD
ncbi:hypothetical protein CAC42_2307 [Sphaceloma murrayae]|uniref:Uncharacterized protein n=1 Tax=Sphaceloma murrayae TaxID=2082308 RepID=A0A2K1QIT6_9PEZI|nr:hypothetical protein CAC42_2307 [Sphaceloma murrayae]